MPSKGLRLVNSPASDASEDDSQLLAAPPIYNSNVPLPPSYSSHPVQKTSPAGPRQPISARNTTSSSSSTGAVSADAGGGSRPPSINDSETYVSVDDGSQPYQETVFSSGAHNMTGERDSKAMFSGSVGEMDTTLSDDNGLSPHDSVSAFGSLTASSSSSQEPRYIYYQVYSDGEAIPAKTSFTEEDPYLGRITAKRIAPPHTATSIKRYLSKQEDISDYSRTTLFSTLSSPSPLEDHGHVSILTAEGPGSSLEEPMALVISDPPTQTVASPSAPVPPLLSSASSIITVNREPNPLYVVGNGQPVVAQINHEPSKEEIKRSKAEEKKRKKAEAKAEAKARTERLAERLKASSKQRAATMAQDQASIRSGRSNDRSSRVPGEVSLFGGLARLAM